MEILKSKREKIIFKKIFLVFSLRSQNYFIDLVTRHYLNVLFLSIKFLEKRNELNNCIFLKLHKNNNENELK